MSVDMDVNASVAMDVNTSVAMDVNASVAMDVNTSVEMWVNTSANASMRSTSVRDIQDMGSIDIITIVFQFALSVFIVGGNVLTILAVHRTRRLHTVANRYVVSLAVADLLAGLVLPLYAVKLIPGVQPVFNRQKFLCLTRFAVLIISAGNSMVTMVQIAVDRLIFIAYPLRYNHIATPFRANVVIATSWMLAVLVGSIPLYYNRWEEAASCDLFNIVTMEYQVYVQFLIFCLCCVVSGTCYTVIFKISYRQRKSIVQQQHSSRRPSSDSSDVKSTFRREWPMIKMFVLVFGVFMVCWTPPMVGVVVGSTVGISMTIVNIFVAICLLNSGMNFIIYGVKNKDFRRAYCRLLCTGRTERRDQLNTSGQSRPSVSGNGFLLA